MRAVAAINADSARNNMSTDSLNNGQRPKTATACSNGMKVPDTERSRASTTGFDPSERCAYIRRYLFTLSRKGEVGSTLEPSPSEDKVHTKRPLLPHAVDVPRRVWSRSEPRPPSRMSVDRPSTTSSSRSSTPSTIPSGGEPTLRYFSVLMNDNELEDRPFDYSKDYRRFAYRDFALGEVQPGSNVAPEVLLKWVLAAKPRNQDDVYPIMQLCKGVLRDLMEEKITCRQQVEDALQAKISDLQAVIKGKERAEEELQAQVEALKGQLAKAHSAMDQLQQDLVRLRSSEYSGAFLAEKEAQISELAARLEESTKANRQLKVQNEELEKKVKAANFMADMRTKDFFKAHNSLTARMQMTPRDLVATWNTHEQYEALACILLEHRKCLELLKSADFHACPPNTRRDLAKKVLESIKVAAPSWVKAVAEVFDSQPMDFLSKVASWYQRENIITDGLKYQQQIEAFKGVIEGTDLTPVYEILRRGVTMGKYSIAELMANCSGRSADENMVALTGLTVEDVEVFREHREMLLRFVQARRSTEAREREEELQKQNLGFLHLGHLRSVDPMEPAAIYRLVARATSRKVALDAKHEEGRGKRVNIMKTTRMVMNEMYATAEVKMQIAKLVRGIEAHSPSCPRLATFGILAGMDPSKPWFERPCAFMMEFITGVVEGLFEDQELLAEFTKANCLLRPDAAAGAAPSAAGAPTDLPAAGDRIEWLLSDHDVEVPVVLLLKSAMNACEVHNCGYGYDLADIQHALERATTGVPAEYAEAQQARIGEARKKLKSFRAQALKQAEEIRVQAVVGRLARNERRVSAEAATPSRERSAENLEQGSFLVRQRNPGVARLSLNGDSCGSFGSSSGRRDRTSMLDFGVQVEPGDKAWLDVFCYELLLAWFRQHTVVEAQLTHIFDDFDKNHDGSLSLEEFKFMIERSPLRNKYSETELLCMYSELTAQDGLLTKRDWLSLFHHVEFDVLTVIRPRRNSIRKMLMEEHWQHHGTCGSPQRRYSGDPECEFDGGSFRLDSASASKLRTLADPNMDSSCRDLVRGSSPTSSPTGSPTATSPSLSPLASPHRSASNAGTSPRHQIQYRPLPRYPTSLSGGAGASVNSVGPATPGTVAATPKSSDPTGSDKYLH